MKYKIQMLIETNTYPPALEEDLKIIEDEFSHILKEIKIEEIKDEKIQNPNAD